MRTKTIACRSDDPDLALATAWDQCSTAYGYKTNPAMFLVRERRRSVLRMNTRQSTSCLGSSTLHLVTCISAYIAFLLLMNRQRSLTKGRAYRLHSRLSPNGPAQKRFFDTNSQYFSPCHALCLSQILTMLSIKSTRYNDLSFFNRNSKPLFI
jgi:hypothetical protein